jgi:uncharacterized protein (DUF885 family)
VSRVVSAALSGAVIGCTFACVFLFARTGHAAPDPGATLDALFASYDRESAPYFPLTASDLGMREYDALLADSLGERYRTGLGGLCAGHLTKLKGIERASLDRQRRLSYDIFRDRLESCIERLAQPWHLLPINQAGSSLPSRFPVIGAGRSVHPFKTVRNYEDFLKRVDGFVVWIDTAIARMKEGVARGITQPRVLIEKVLPQLEAQIADDPRTSLFYEPVTNFPADFDAQTREALAAKYLEAIERRIIPAYRKLAAFLKDDYLPRCRLSDGFGELPGGSAMYRRAVRVSTTTDLAPARIHDIGVAEVARIREQMKIVQARIDSTQEPPPPRHRTADELVRAYAELRDPVAAAMSKLFGSLPRSDFEIRAIEGFRERSMPSSYVAPSPDGTRGGVFYLNTAGAKTANGAAVSRSLYLHEAVPGHHLQIALQRENHELPRFRRIASYTAFVEGWALYAEHLGDEAGIYRTAHDKLAMLRAELLRAARLVVDVGLHEKGWSRQQAIDYLVGTVGSAKETAEREAERYMAWPAQALGYKIGALKILELRGKAQAALGAGFDIRAFHDEVLKDGAMPLYILEAKMDEWIAQQRPPAAATGR